MSDAWLQRLYATIVVGLLVWPVPHYYLTDAIGSDPWKNGIRFSVGLPQRSTIKTNIISIACGHL